MQPSRTLHGETGSGPGSNTTPDIIIPPPAGAPPHPDTTQMTQVPARVAGAQDMPVALSSIQIVIVAVLVVVWAGLLIFARRLLTQSLVAQFADLGRARAAGTTMYLFLLVLGATLAVCAVGGYWQDLEITIPAAVLNVVMLMLFLASYGGARSSRQRR